MLTNVKILGENVKVKEDDRTEAKAIVVVNSDNEYSYQYLLDDRKWVKINKFPQSVGDICDIYEINNRVYVVDTKGISTLDNEFYKLPSGREYSLCFSCLAGDDLLVFRECYEKPFCKLLDTKNKKISDFSFQTIMQQETKVFAVVYYLNQFWIIGGKEPNYYDKDNCPEPVNTIQIYDPILNTTSLSPLRMVQARSNHQVIVYKDKLFVFGGEEKPLSPLNSVEMYCPKTNKFVMMAPMKHARSNFACCRAGNLVYVIGGSYDFPESMEIYNLDTNVWTDGVDSPGFDCHLYLYACAVNNYIC